MKAKLLNDTLDASSADCPAALAKLLRDDVGRCVRVKEAVTNHLPHYLLGSSMVGFWAALATEQGQGALISECTAKLKIALLAEAEFLRRLSRPDTLAFAFDQHGKLSDNFVVIGPIERPGCTYERKFFEVEPNHVHTSPLFSVACRYLSVELA